jgi:hypothetical protein
MEPRPLEIGEIVQINPTANRGVDWFGACLMVVTEPKSFGAQGYVKNAGSSGLAFIRVKFEDMEPTGGHVQWMSVQES